MQLFTGKAHSHWTLDAHAAAAGMRAGTDVEASKRFEAQQAAARQLGVKGTPAFIVFDARTSRATRLYRLQDLAALLQS